MFFHKAYFLVRAMIHSLNIKISSSSKFQEEKHKKSLGGGHQFWTVVSEDVSEVIFEQKPC